ncbi:TPA: tRNA 2-thiouridine(34) synthase MnmA [Candidatus Nomurabacteria bacterium]|nr:tRNA 2-thiouridine(34) synthase MnmA [Candidatus Nomurabacteria bacterium]
MESKRKVFVGMSGGVDSSVSAALLKQQGYDVTGVFIKVWQPDFIECTWKQDRLDAMRVVSVLDIPFITLDLEKEYKEGVIDYMISEYRSGRTPNPDVMCNREVKFGAFLKWAMAQGADHIATGHYSQACVIPVKAGIQVNIVASKFLELDSRFHGNDNSSYSLKKSKDENKDQTYFLWTLTQEQLSKIIFPIGEMEKSHVRELAREFNLPVSEKKDSQGLCFVGTIDVKTLLKNYIKEKRGDVKNESGDVIGSHDGVTFFTIGERHGFNITKKTIEDKPYFVIAKNFEENTLIVSNNPPHEKDGNIISLEKINWTKEIKKGEVYEARARYRAPLAKVEVINEKEMKVVGGDPPAGEAGLTATPGQSLVLYDGELCIGGGIIR